MNYSGLVCLLVVIFSVSFLEVNSNHGEGIVVVGSDGHASFSPSVALCWSRCLNVPDLKFTSEVKPITENPKVRDLTYKYEVKIINLDDFAKMFEFDWFSPIESETTKDVVRKVVHFHMYELNNAHSKELAAFYNPLDPNQVEELNELVTSYVNPKIEYSGLAVEVIDFEIK